VLISTYMIGFRGYRIQICYLNFLGSKECCYGNQIGKNKQKLHKFQFCIKYWKIFRVNSRVLGVSEFKYIIGIFKGSKGVAMATEFKQMSAKIALISVLFKKSINFSCEL